MAKATAYCTCATCGKQFKYVTTKRNVKEAESFVKWAEAHIDECQECEDKRIAEERAAANEAAKAEATEQGWPELTGTEKQVAWATTIRANVIKEISGRFIIDDFRKAYEQALAELLVRRTSASWWIDNRYTSTAFMLELDEIAKEQASKTAEQKAAEEAARAAKEAAKAAEAAAEEAAKNDTATIAEPIERKHDGVVDITAAKQYVSATYAKSEAFREVVKGLGYRWNPDGRCWYLNIDVRTGASAERAAELGSHLLNAGFAIRIQDADTLRRAVEADYEPMHRRWIRQTTADPDKLTISWPREDDLYSAAKRLPGARYSRPDIVVPPSEWTAVLEFARVYDFRITPAAQRLIDAQRAATEIVQPEPPKEPVYDEHPLSGVLESSREVLTDLRDE